MAPKAGSRFRLEGAVDDEGSRTSVGVGNGAIPVGTVVEVREVVSADTPGAHDSSEDAVVVTWEEPSVVRTEAGGEPSIGYVTRAWSCGASDFDRLFKRERGD